MGRIKVNHKYTVKKNIKEGICHIIENGKGCKRKTHCRGVCSRHHTYFLRWGLLKKYGTKHLYVYAKGSHYKINKKRRPGKCYLIENSKQCTKDIHARRLCKSHWLKLCRHGLLLKYGGPSQKDPHTFKLRKKLTKGKCRIDEDNKPCKNKPITRGLCPKHYLRFLREGRLDKFAKKSTKQPR